MDAKLVEEEEPQQRAVGRPGKIVRLARSGVCVLGLVVGPVRRSGRRTAASVHVGDRDVELANPDKVLWPQAGTTKRELLDYMVAVAPVLLPHLDEAMANILRKSTKPVFLVVNKVDNHSRLLEASEFYSLGFEKIFFLSSVSGRRWQAFYEHALYLVFAWSADDKRLLLTVSYEFDAVEIIMLS